MDRRARSPPAQGGAVVVTCRVRVHCMCSSLALGCRGRSIRGARSFVLALDALEGMDCLFSVRGVAQQSAVASPLLRCTKISRRTRPKSRRASPSPVNKPRLSQLSHLHSPLFAPPRTAPHIIKHCPRKAFFLSHVFRQCVRGCPGHGPSDQCRWV